MMRHIRKGLVLLLAAASWCMQAPAAGMPESVLREATRLPVQDGGRVKPLDTHARFTLLQLSGRTTCRTEDGRRLGALEWFLELLLHPDRSATHRVFLVENAEAMDSIGLPHDGPRQRFAYADLAPHRATLFQAASQYAMLDRELRTPAQEQVLRLTHNVHAYEAATEFMDAFAAAANGGGGNTLRLSDLLANPPDPAAPRAAYAGVYTAAARATALSLIPPVDGDDGAVEWLSPADLLHATLEDRTPSAEQLAVVRLLEQASDGRGDPERLATHLAALNAKIREMTADNRQVAQIPRENFLYRLQPFYYSLVLYVAVFLLAALSWLAPARRWPYRLSVIALAFPLALHTYGIVLRCVIRARPPVTTLYETLLFISAVAAACALVLECITRRRVAVAMGAFLGAVGLFLANRYEAVDGRDTMPSLIAVLDTNFWLATHVTTITIGYAAGLLAGALAHLYLFGKALGWKRDDAAFYRHLTRMVYGVLCFGLLFATAGTVLGGIWANESWGRFWGWDPKENGALMIVLWGLAVLHARLGGYIRDFGVNMAALFGGVIVAFSWFGVNMLGVGLHSYGFTSGVHRALTTFYLIEMAALMVGGFAWLREQEIVRIETTDSGGG